MSEASDSPQQKKGQSKPQKPRKLFMKQKIMLRVVYALIPIAIAGIYFFGWRVLGTVAVCAAAGIATEYITSRQRGTPISMAVFVSVGLYSLSLPPGMPFWMSAVGIVVAILFGKEVFGGFGRNFANPAIVGRAFVYVCFPAEMTGQFVPVFRGWPGGFAQWSFTSLKDAPAYLAEKGLSLADAVTAATPGWARRDFGYEATSAWDLLVGNIGGTFQGEFETQALAAGSIGEVSAALIILAGLYLILTKTANWRLTLSTLLGAGAVILVLHELAGIWAVPDWKFSFLGGSLLYGAVFMVTDPVSAPKRKLAQYAYGAFIGMMVILLRWKSQFAAALSFSILLGNLVGPLLDMGAGEIAARRRARAKARKEKATAETDPGDAEKELSEAERKKAAEQTDPTDATKGPEEGPEGATA